jgi:hypothetical protein
MAFPALLSAALFAAGCGGGSGSDPTASGPEDPGDGPEPLAPPAIAMIDPAIGPPAGGTELTILGSGFLEGVEGAVSVTLGGKPALEVTVVDDGTLTCVTPAADPELVVDVRVENSRGAGVLPEAFTYLSVPSINTDLNDDGIPDLVISAPTDGSGGDYSGSVYVFYGLPAPDHLPDMTAGQANVKIMGVFPNDQLGSAVASGDVNGDGKDDLVVGASYADADGAENSGAVYVFLGPLPDSATLSANQADIFITNQAGGTNDRFGGSLAVGDVDGDLVLDVLVGATGVDRLDESDDVVADAGMAFLFFGGAELADTDAAAADVVVAGNEPGDKLGSSCLLADLSGDGLADLVVGAYLANPVVPPKKYDAGAVYVFFGGEGLAGGLAADADLEFSGEEPEDEFGTTLACGDMNADGKVDLMVSAPGSQALGSETGRAYVFLGASEPAGMNATLADAIYSGQQGNGDFGRDLTAADMNGDGFADLAIGAPRNSQGAIKNGRSYVFLGAETLEDGLSHSADVIYTGEEQDYCRFGSALEVIDMNGDGLADVISAALGSNGGGVGSGRVHVFDGVQDLHDEDAYGDDLTLTGEAAESKFGSSISPGM